MTPLTRNSRYRDDKANVVSPEPEQKCLVVWESWEWERSEEVSEVVACGFNSHEDE